MVDPAGLVDHVEIETVGDPETITVVLELFFSIQDSVDVGDELAAGEIPAGYDAVAVDGRTEYADTGIDGHRGAVCTGRHFCQVPASSGPIHDRHPRLEPSSSRWSFH